MIAYCGLVCSSCPTFLATQNDDDSAREKTAAFYTEKFGFNLKPEDINCDGCLATTERIFNYCKICRIRKCGMERKVKNCAYCEDYACDKLNQFYERAAPEVKQTLDEIKKSL